MAVADPRDVKMAASSPEKYSSALSLVHTGRMSGNRHLACVCMAAGPTEAGQRYGRACWKTSIRPAPDQSVLAGGGAPLSEYNSSAGDIAVLTSDS